MDGYWVLGISYWVLGIGYWVLITNCLTKTGSQQKSIPRGLFMVVRKYSRMMILSLFLLLPFIHGCTFLDNYAKIRIASGQYANTINDIMAHLKDYSVSYAGLSVENPSAILFDPKIDGRSITYEKWVPVTDEAVVATIIKWLGANVNFPPYLWKIVGNNDQLFGYIYTSAEVQVVMKKIDDKTLFAENIPLPPIDYGPSGRF